jgi:hypothetical protein
MTGSAGARSKPKRVGWASVLSLESQSGLKTTL